ncbi:MAG: hypothetical protein NWE95_12765 [Candidatus Bathyarchaeota archaeon]|nr:hypothetical protein [Candidatus Bathyarchaeota archaeon]
MLQAIIKIFAKNPPSIAIALAGTLALLGRYSEATSFLFGGILLQVLWLFLRRH